MQRLKLTESKHYSPVFGKIKGQILALWCKVAVLPVVLPELTMPGVVSARGKGGTGEPALLWERGRGQEVFPSERLVQLWGGAGVLWRSLSGEILLAATAVGPRAGN